MHCAIRDAGSAPRTKLREGGYTALRYAAPRGEGESTTPPASFCASRKAWWPSRTTKLRGERRGLSFSAYMAKLDHFVRSITAFAFKKGEPAVLDAIRLDLGQKAGPVQYADSGP